MTLKGNKSIELIFMLCQTDTFKTTWKATYPPADEVQCGYAWERDEAHIHRFAGRISMYYKYRGVYLPILCDMALIYSYKNTPNSRTSIDFFPGVLKDSREGGESPRPCCLWPNYIDRWQKKQWTGFFFRNKAFLNYTQYSIWFRVLLMPVW